MTHFQVKWTKKGVELGYSENCVSIQKF